MMQEGKARRAEALNAALSDMESWLSSGEMLPEKSVFQGILQA